MKCENVFLDPVKKLCNSMKKFCLVLWTQLSNKVQFFTNLINNTFNYDVNSDKCYNFLFLLSNESTGNIFHHKMTKLSYWIKILKPFNGMNNVKSSQIFIFKALLCCFLYENFEIFILMTILNNGKTMK